MLKRIPTRVVLGFLLATGLMELYMSRTNLSIAIVEMVQVVNSETVMNAPPKQPFCLQHKNTSFPSSLNVTKKETMNENYEEKIKAPIKISSTQRGNILSAFFYAYGMSAILGGRLAEKYGTKIIFGMAVLCDVIGNLLIPVSSKSNYIFLIIIRFVMGFFQGMCYPSMHSLLSKWIPMSESSRFLGSVYMANSFGTIFTLQVGGVIVSDYGHEMAFYISALLGLIWLLFWVLFMYNTPEVHPRISDKEKDYILENRPKSLSGKNQKKVPWLKIFTSLPVWAICLAHAGSMFGLGFMLTQLPIYLSSIIGLNIKANGLLSSLPHVARYLGSNLISISTNFLMKKTNWTKRTWHRICTFLSHWCPGLCILLVGYVGCNPTAALVLLSLAMFLNGASCSGYLTNHWQIAPSFSGTVYGTTNTIAFSFTSLGPVIIGALTSGQTLSEWMTVYWFIFGSYLICGLFFMTCLSTELQPWSDIPEKSLYEDAKDSQEIESLPLKEDAKDSQEVESLQKA